MCTRMIRCFAFVSLLVAAPLAGAEQAAGPSGVEEIMAYLGFDRSDYGKLMRGEIINTGVKEVSDKELAVSIAVLTTATLEDVAEMVRQGKTLDVGREVIEYQRLSGGPPSAGDFAGLGFTEKEINEVSRLLKARAGSDFNLSAAEIKRFQQIARRLRGKNPRRDPAVRDAINAGLREMLQERYKAYREGGLAAIAPYERGGNNRAEPGKELTLATKEDAILPENLKDFERAFADYPKGGADNIESHFYWIKQSVQNRPTFVLRHDMVQVRPDGVLFGARQFYVGQSYNSLHIVVGCVPVDDGVVVFYRNRTSTDQVAGFGSGFKKGIGRGQMLDTIVEHFSDLRKALEAAD